MNANKKYKDTVFSLYWSDPERLIELYNAVEGTNYPSDTPVEVNTLEDALYKDRINDVSFLLGNELIVLVEHQSTLNDNMPLRMFLYLARLYEKYLQKTDRGALYKISQIPIPTPKLYVLYNGEAKAPKHSKLRLSDAYIAKNSDGEYQVDLTVKQINVNFDEDDEILQNSESLRQYSLFVFKVREEIDAGKPLEKAIQSAIRFCVENDIMQEFLSDHGSEVANMLFDDWDMDRAMKVRYQEGEAKGRAEGEAKGESRMAMLCQKLAESGKADIIAKITTDGKLREKLYKEFGL